MKLLNADPYVGFDTKNRSVDLSGWMQIKPVDVFKTLILEVKPEIIIEVGTWKGLSAIHMGKIIKENNLKCKIYCVDTWLGCLRFLIDDNERMNLQCLNGYPTVYYQFLHNVISCEMADIIKPIPNTSSIACQLFHHHKIKADLIFIDGSHSYRDVLLDIRNYQSLLNKNGVMFGDDYGKGFPAVIRAVNDYARIHDKEIETIMKYWIYR